jgi:hypothetical protein
MTDSPGFRQVWELNVLLESLLTHSLASQTRKTSSLLNKLNRYPINKLREKVACVVTMRKVSREIQWCSSGITC